MRRKTSSARCFELLSFITNGDFGRTSLRSTNFDLPLRVRTNTLEIGGNRTRLTNPPLHPLDSVMLENKFFDYVVDAHGHVGTPVIGFQWNFDTSKFFEPNRD